MIEKLDELYQAMHAKQYCHGYHEEPIHFDPTYKRSTSDNSTYINKKDQCPSYTDRILVKLNEESIQAQYNAYGSAEEILGSDHRPVFLDFAVTIKQQHYMEPK